MNEILLATIKKKSSGKPGELIGNYEIIPIPAGPAGRMQNGGWTRGNELFIVFGVGAIQYQDFWSLNLDDFTWQNRGLGAGGSMSAVAGYAATYSEKYDFAMTGGGVTSGGIYAAGRYNFNHVTNQWDNSSNPGMPSGMSGNAYGTLATKDNKFYHIGGYYSSGGIQWSRGLSVMDWEGVKNWTTKANVLPATTSPENVGMVFVGNYLYIRVSNEMYRINPDTESVATLHGKTTAFNPLNSKYMFEFGGDIYFVARVDQSGTQRSYLIKYEVETQTWTMFGTLPGDPIQLPTIGYYNGALWAWSGAKIGGTVTYPNQLIKIT